MGTPLSLLNAEQQVAFELRYRYTGARVPRYMDAEPSSNEKRSRLLAARKAAVTQRQPVPQRSPPKFKAPSPSKLRRSRKKTMARSPDGEASGSFKHPQSPKRSPSSPPSNPGIASQGISSCSEGISSSAAVGDEQMAKVADVAARRDELLRVLLRRRGASGDGSATIGEGNGSGGAGGDGGTSCGDGGGGTGTGTGGGDGAQREAAAIKIEAMTRGRLQRRAVQERVEAAREERRGKNAEAVNAARAASAEAWAKQQVEGDERARVAAAVRIETAVRRRALKERKAAEVEERRKEVNAMAAVRKDGLAKEWLNEKHEPLERAPLEQVRGAEDEGLEGALAEEVS